MSSQGPWAAAAHGTLPRYGTGGLGPDGGGGGDRGGAAGPPGARARDRRGVRKCRADPAAFAPAGAGRDRPPRPPAGRPAPGRDARARGVGPPARRRRPARSTRRARPTPSARWPRSRPSSRGAPGRWTRPRTACAGWRRWSPGSSTRGAAGENILARALAQLPPDLLEMNVAFGNKIVEYALRLPGGRYLPIDSKWTSVGVARAPGRDGRAAQERKRLVEQVVRDVRGRIRDMAKYLDPERTLSLGLLAVPDAVYDAAPEAHGEGYREGVLVVPYSLALPYVLALYRLTLRFGCAVDTDQLADRLRGLDEALRRLDEEVEGAPLARARAARERPRRAARPRSARRAASTRPAARDEPRRRAVGRIPCPTPSAAAIDAVAGSADLRLARIVVARMETRGDPGGGRARRAHGRGPPQGVPAPGRRSRCSCAAARAFDAAPSVDGDRGGRARRRASTRRASCCAGWRKPCGGGGRAASGARTRCAPGLAALPAGFDGIVLVHDAARPLVEPTLIDAVAAAAGERGAAIPVLPLVDTIKRVRGRDACARPSTARELAAAQTPQGVPPSRCCASLRRGAFATASPLTDEAMAVERLGQPVARGAGLARATARSRRPTTCAWAEHAPGRGEQRVTRASASAPASTRTAWWPAARCARRRAHRRTRAAWRATPTATACSTPCATRCWARWPPGDMGRHFPSARPALEGRGQPASSWSEVARILAERRLRAGERWTPP